MKLSIYYSCICCGMFFCCIIIWSFLRTFLIFLLRFLFTLIMLLANRKLGLIFEYISHGFPRLLEKNASNILLDSWKKNWLTLGESHIPKMVATYDAPTPISIDARNNLMFISNQLSISFALFFPLFIHKKIHMFLVPFQKCGISHTWH